MKRRRSYLLRAVLKCGLCGRTFSGTPGRGDYAWYRCNGTLALRRDEGKCTAKIVFGNHLEQLVWADIEGYLRNPGDVIEELREQVNDTSAAAAREADLQFVQRALQEIPDQRDRLLEIFSRGKLTEDELDRQMTRIESEEDALRRRLAELEPEPIQPQETPSEALLAEIRARLDQGLDFEARQEIVLTLVKQITVHTEVGERGKKQSRAVVEYRFPVVIDDDTPMDCTPRPA
jgi:site-specific DNA recombinase